MAIYLGANHHRLLVPFLICEAVGVFVYVLEVRDRFRNRGGSRR